MNVKHKNYARQHYSHREKHLNMISEKSVLRSLCQSPPQVSMTACYFKSITLKKKAENRKSHKSSKTKIILNCPQS